MKKLLSGIVLLGIIGVGAFSVYVQSQRLKRPRATPPHQETASPQEAFGHEDAKVVITAFVPFQAPPYHPPLQILRTLVQKDPARLRVELYDLAQRSNQRAMQDRGLTDATILINGQAKFTRPEASARRKVSFIGPPDGDSSKYRSEDLVAALDEALRQAYGTGLSEEQRATLKQIASAPQRASASSATGEEEPAKKAARSEPRPKATPGGKSKVNVEVFLFPPDSPAAFFFTPARQVVEEMARQHPDRLTVTYHDRSDPAVEDLLAQRGCPEACVLINGKVSHVLKQGSQEKTVRLEKAKGQPAILFDPADLKAVLQQYLRGS